MCLLCDGRQFRNGKDHEVLIGVGTCLPNCTYFKTLPSGSCTPEDIASQGKPGLCSYVRGGETVNWLHRPLWTHNYILNVLSLLSDLQRITTLVSFVPDLN
jgi:hypothetical protein